MAPPYSTPKPPPYTRFPGKPVAYRIQELAIAAEKEAVTASGALGKAIARQARREAQVDAANACRLPGPV